LHKEVSKFVGILLGSILLFGWIAGSSPNDSASLANREPASWPFQSINDLIEFSKWADLNGFLLDHLRIKVSATSAVNSLSLKVTGMTMSSKVIAGPIKFNKNQIDSEYDELDLFYSQDFTRACGELKYSNAAESALLKLKEINNVGKFQARFVVAANKSSFPIKPNSWSNALLSCSVDVRQTLINITNEFYDSSMLKLLPNNAWQSPYSAPYWSGDTHWTPKGAMEVSNFLISEGLLKASALSRLDTESGPNGSRTQDLWAMLGTKNEVEVSFIRTKFPDQTQELEPKSNMRHFRTQENVDVDTRSILFVYDSFGFVPELEGQIAPMYEESYFVTWEGFDPKKLPNVDVVIFESVERSTLSRLSTLVELESGA
jgi:hypothetical protein